jgi:hypothetical protein
VTPAGWLLICFVSVLLVIFLYKFWEKRKLKQKLKNEEHSNAGNVGSAAMKSGSGQVVELTSVYKGSRDDSRISTASDNPATDKRTRAGERTSSKSMSTSLSALQRSSLVQGISAELSKMSSKAGPALLPKIKIMLGIWQILGGLPG